MSGRNDRGGLNAGRLETGLLSTACAKAWSPMVSSAGGAVCSSHCWHGDMRGPLACFFPFISKILSLLKEKPFTGLPGLIFAAFFPLFSYLLAC